jgi:hypothetical protein
MHSNGVARKWAEAGTRWCVFMQDTNGLALHVLGAALGVSVSLGLEVNSMAIPRKAKQVRDSFSTTITAVMLLQLLLLLLLLHTCMSAV